MTRVETAFEKFGAGYNCAQSVLYAFCKDLGLDGDTALRLICGFGGGMARKQEICGAVSGAIAAIGLKHGQGESQGKAAKEATYKKVREMMARFEAEHGSCLCRVLLRGCDLNTPEGQRASKEDPQLDAICKNCVKTAVEAVEAAL